MKTKINSSWIVFFLSTALLLPGSGANADEAQPPAAVPPPPAAAAPAPAAPAAAAPAAPVHHHHAKKKEEEPHFSWLDFSLSGLAVFNSTGSAYSGEVSWTPHFVINEKLEFGLNLGGSGLGNVLGQSFPVVEYQLTGAYEIYHSVGAELGAGGQTWGGPNGVTAAAFSGNLFYKLHISVLDKVFVGYTADLISHFYTSEVKLGVGFHF